MVVTIRKGETRKQIEAAVSKLEKKKSSKHSLADYYGKLKGRFGDGLKYQKSIRNEWD